MKLLAKVLHAAFKLLSVFLAALAFIARRSGLDTRVASRGKMRNRQVDVHIEGLGLAGFGASVSNFVIWSGFKENNEHRQSWVQQSNFCSHNGTVRYRCRTCSITARSDHRVSRFSL